VRSLLQRPHLPSSWRGFPTCCITNFQSADRSECRCGQRIGNPRYSAAQRGRNQRGARVCDPQHLRQHRGLREAWSLLPDPTRCGSQSPAPPKSPRLATIPGDTDRLETCATSLRTARCVKYPGDDRRHASVREAAGPPTRSVRGLEARDPGALAQPPRRVVALGLAVATDRLLFVAGSRAQAPRNSGVSSTCRWPSCTSASKKRKR